MKQRYELSKQVQELHVDLTLFSVTYLNFMKGSLFQITTFIGPNAIRAEKAELPLRSGQAFSITM
jgi:hypothetical protein